MKLIILYQSINSLNINKKKISWTNYNYDQTNKIISYIERSFQCEIIHQGKLTYRRYFPDIVVLMSAGDITEFAGYSL